MESTSFEIKNHDVEADNFPVPYDVSDRELEQLKIVTTQLNRLDSRLEIAMRGWFMKSNPRSSKAS